ncbi:MAG: Hpt domain-containing protein [Burkholderiales bacterium]|nr:Hpt domain-containing protein [Phycisphaerae bacterium]
MLSAFIEIAPTTMHALREAIATGQTSDAQRHAHTLKGSAANLAMPTLEKLAREMEHLIGGDTDEAARKLSEVEDHFDLCVNDAERYRNEL